MFDLTINGKVYEFNFGVGFAREINKMANADVGDSSGLYNDDGLQRIIGGILDGNVISIVDALYAANKTCDPRVTKELLEGYVDTMEDFDEFIDRLRDFLLQNNATSKVMKRLQIVVDQQAIAIAKARQEIEDTKTLMETSAQMTQEVSKFRKKK